MFSWDENNLKGGAGFWEMAVSDINANYIIVGGIHNWRSKDGGQTWDRVGAHDSNLPQNKWTHCDVHFLTFLPGDTLTYFSCNDGGIYKTSDDGENWEIKIGSMGTYLTYTLGNSSISENKFVTGTQDNSTVLYNGEEFVLVGGGDGMQCFFDRTDDNYIYVTAQGGWALMSSDGGYNWSNITNYTGDAAWNAPFMQDPENSSTIYIARQRIFKSVNRGSSWQSIGSFNTSNPIFSIDICESNSSIIWCTDYWTSNIYRLEGTTNYEQFNNPSGTRIESIIAHPDDPLKAYIACTGFDPGSKVFATEDGGQTWENISNGLPNLPVNCIYYHRGSNDRIYIGLNVGLFYRDNESNGWVQMDEGLPHSEITDIDYFYPTNKLRVAVYGRGIWETEIPRTVSVNSIKSESEVIVFPNPVENVLNIKLNDNQEGIVEILDLKGQKLHEERILVDHKQLDCTNLNPGVYIIRFTTTGNKIFSSKFIKQ